MSDQQITHKQPQPERPVEVTLKNSSKALGLLERKWPVALVFSIFFGWIGIDQFYLGRTGKGILKLFTLGLFGILWVIDIIMIATKSVSGVVWKERNPHKSWLSEYKAVVIVLAIVFLVIIAGAAASSSNSSSNSSNGTKASNSSPKTYRFADRADKQAKDVELLPGESGTVGGVKLTVSDIKYATSLGEFDNADSGKTFLVATVAMENTSKSTQSYNEVDFRVQTASGQVLDGTVVSSLTNLLNSGDLVTGGKVSGQVVFQVPVETGHQYLIWKPGLESDRAIVQTK